MSYELQHSNRGASVPGPKSNPGFISHGWETQLSSGLT